MEQSRIIINEIKSESFIEEIRKIVALEVSKLNDFKLSDTESHSDKLLTRKEAKELLQTSFTTLWNYGRQGFLKPKKIGGRVYYLKSEILSYLKNESLTDKQ